LILNPKDKSFKQGIAKRQTFSESVPKITAHVPGPNKYNTTIDWNKTMPHVTQRMAKATKLTYIDEIIKMGKSPEKTSPSPQFYMKEKAFEKT
jgi:hypothetical protein